jgi:hypothetical protein
LTRTSVPKHAGSSVSTPAIQLQIGFVIGGAVMLDRLT